MQVETSIFAMSFKDLPSLPSEFGSSSCEVDLSFPHSFNICWWLLGGIEIFFLLGCFCVPLWTTVEKEKEQSLNTLTLEKTLTVIFYQVP